MADIEIGLGKSGRRAYGLDEVAIVPNRRARDPENVDVSWRIDAYQLDVPFLSAPMDSVTSPATAVALGRLGGLGVLNLEGLWTRYEDPASAFEEIDALDDESVTARLQELYAEPVKDELILARLAEIRAGGVLVAGSVTPQHAAAFLPVIRKADVDILVIQGTVVSAEYVSRTVDPLNLKTFIRALDVPVIVGGCASYQAALHLMRTGAAGVLVGVGAGRTSTTRSVLGLGAPLATAIADARAARMRHLDETGVYCHLIADGGMASGADIAKAIVCGADAVMLGAPLAATTEAPGRGSHWGKATWHPTLPRGGRVRVERVGTLQEVLLGPARRTDGRRNLVGALRRAMAFSGYETLKEFQKADLVVTPSAGDLQ